MKSTSDAEDFLRKKYPGLFSGSALREEARHPLPLNELLIMSELRDEIVRKNAHIIKASRQYFQETDSQTAANAVDGFEFFNAEMSLITFRLKPDLSLSLLESFLTHDQADEMIGDLFERQIQQAHRHGAKRAIWIMRFHCSTIIASRLYEISRKFLAQGFDLFDDVISRLLHSKHLYFRLAVGVMMLGLVRRLFAKLLAFVG